MNEQTQTAWTELLELLDAGHASRAEEDAVSAKLHSLKSATTAASQFEQLEQDWATHCLIKALAAYDNETQTLDIYDAPSPLGLDEQLGSREQIAEAVLARIRQDARDRVISPRQDAPRRADGTPKQRSVGRASVPGRLAFWSAAMAGALAALFIVLLTQRDVTTAIDAGPGVGTMNSEASPKLDGPRDLIGSSPDESRPSERDGSTRKTGSGALEEGRIDYEQPPTRLANGPGEGPRVPWDAGAPQPPNDAVVALPPHDPNGPQGVGTEDAVETDWLVAETEQEQTPPEWSSPVPKKFGGETLRLLKGAATLLTRDARGATNEFTVHAPAEFRPEKDGRLFLKRGGVVTRGYSSLSIRVDTPYSQLNIVNRASIVADEYGTAVRAYDPVVLNPGLNPGLQSAFPSTAASPGDYRWVSRDGGIYDWRVAMLASEGAILVTVNDQVCPVSPSPFTLGHIVIAHLTRQLQGKHGTAKGAVIVDDETYHYEGVRGLQQAARRINDQFLQRQRVAIAGKHDLMVNGVTLFISPASSPRTTMIASGGPSVRPPLAIALDRQLQMAAEMEAAFGIDLGDVRRTINRLQRKQEPLTPPPK